MSFIPPPPLVGMGGNTDGQASGKDASNTGFETWLRNVSINCNTNRWTAEIRHPVRVAAVSHSAAWTLCVPSQLRPVTLSLISCCQPARKLRPLCVYCGTAWLGTLFYEIRASLNTGKSPATVVTTSSYSTRAGNQNTSVFWNIKQNSLVKVDVSKKHTVSIFKLCLQPPSCWSLAWFTLRPRRWRRNVPRNVDWLSPDYVAIYPKDRNLQ
jgi:hypothetical protein